MYGTVKDRMQPKSKQQENEKGLPERTSSGVFL